jgi:ribose-phosphate pyrophosphokinase
MAEEFVVFCGNASRTLGRAVVRGLGTRAAAARSELFPDGEVNVEILDSVREKDVFIVQSTSPPVNDHVMELLAFADACRRASAARIFAVIPYFGYARSDKRMGGRQPIGARLVADLLQTAGVDHVITVDLHASQIEGFFRVPVDSISAVPVLCDAVRRVLPAGTVVVSPDAGRLKVAMQYAQGLNTSVVLLHKTRATGSETHVTHLVGDVRGRPCLIVDDMISTGGTIADSVDKLLEAGALPGVFVAATHGLLLKGARAKLGIDGIADLFITDTVEQPPDIWPRVHVVSVATCLAEVIRRVTLRETVSHRGAV